MSMYDLQGLEAPKNDPTTMASNWSFWSCGSDCPSYVSWFACC
ncbi:SapB/AmfS family lanthipeptide [Streptomyces tsukubensis]